MIYITKAVSSLTLAHLLLRPHSQGLSPPHKTGAKDIENKLIVVLQSNLLPRALPMNRGYPSSLDQFLRTRLVTNLFLDRTKDLCFCERFHGPSLVCHIDNFAAVLLKPHFIHQ